VNLLQDYQLYGNGCLQLFFNDGDHRICRITKDSGRIVTRKKVAGSNIDHPGIMIGEDIYTNEPYILHNHYELFGTAGVSTFSEYASGKEVFWDNRPCTNSKRVVLKKGLIHAIEGKPYKLLSNNCQVTINDSFRNERTSEDVIKWFGRAAAGALVVLVLNVMLAD
jgi:hypothetical protein